MTQAARTSFLEKVDSLQLTPDEREVLNLVKDLLSYDDDELELAFDFLAQDDEEFEEEESPTIQLYPSIP